MTMNDLLFQAIVSIAEFIQKYAVTLAALGALTMALIEAYKKLFGILGKFQSEALRQWLQQDTVDGTEAPKKARQNQHYIVPASAVALVQAGEQQKPYASQGAYRELLHLTTGLSMGAEDEKGVPETLYSRRVSCALFELDLARMMGQIQEAADAALNNPELYPNWFAFLTRGCSPKDRSEWLEAMDRRSGSNSTDSTSGDTKHLADVYGRIRLLMRRQLDSFQTVTSFRWREANQKWAIILGAVLMGIAQIMVLVKHSQDVSFSIDFSTIGQLVLISVLGGVLAPVAKDLVDALAKVKSGG